MPRITIINPFVKASWPPLFHSFSYPNAIILKKSKPYQQSFFPTVFLSDNSLNGFRVIKIEIIHEQDNLSSLRSKESWPKGPGFVLSPEGICFIESSLTNEIPNNKSQTKKTIALNRFEICNLEFEIYL